MEEQKLQNPVGEGVVEGLLAFFCFFLGLRKRRKVLGFWVMAGFSSFSGGGGVKKVKIKGVGVE